MKALKPSHREKKRYLLIRGNDAKKKIIEEVILDFIGGLGYAEASPRVIKQTSKSLILSINREFLDKIRTSFLMSEKNLDIVKVSGSLKKLK